MKEIAYCGYNCSTCLGWIAYYIEDKKEQNEYLKVYSSVIPCSGCHEDENICKKTCGTCLIRNCGIQKDISTCSECKEYPCLHHMKS